MKKLSHSGRRVLLSITAGLCLFAFAFFFQQHTASADTLTFSGYIQNPNGSAFLEGGGVNLMSNSAYYNTGISGNDGSFLITGIQPGTYTLDVGVSQSSTYANPAQQQVTLTSSVSGFIVSVATPTVRGIVANPDGSPTNGCVTVRDATWTVNREYCAGSDGIFKIGAIQAGSYFLEANPPGNSPYVQSTQSITITDSSTTLDVGTVRLDTPFIIGKVALPDGTLVPWNDDYSQRIHLSVDIWSNDGTVNIHSDYDSNSMFKFGHIPAGTYSLHVNVWDTELYTGSATQSITVTSDGLDMTATPVQLSTPQLAGVVYRPDGVTPVQNAYVSLHSDDWATNQGSSTDANGKYRIGGVGAGTYKVNVNPPNDMTDVVRIDDTDIAITTSLTTRNFTLTGASKYVIGTVKKNGVGVSCANVNANLRGGSGWAGAQTASDGTYRLTLTPGSWNIRVEPNNSWNCPQADWIFLDPEAIIDFSNDSTTQTETVNLNVTKATARITGTVKTKSGAAVTNGNVNANSQTQDGRNRSSNAQIKADGTYALNLIAGTYDLNVWTQDNRLYVKNQKVVIADNETKTVNFTMNEKLAHIMGTVTDKAGKPLPNIQLNGNLDCGPNGCSAWSSTKTDANGFYDLAATAGRWNINFDSGQGAAYVYDGPGVEVYVSSETATMANNNFALTYADVTITGFIVDESGQTFSEFPGWAYVRPTTVTAGAGYREYGGPVDRGAFRFRMPSSLFSQGELGVHAPQNSQYSAVAGVTITIVADATINTNITVKKNDAAIFGRVIDSSGLPLGKCDFRGEVFANTPSGEWHGTQMNPDCSWEISLLAGTYQLGYHMEESAGFLNRPMNEQITVASGTRVNRDLKVLKGDATITILVLKPDGSLAQRAWVWADNHREIDEAQRSGEQQGNQEGFRGPGGTKSPDELFSFCSKKENEKECADFKLPPGSEGPGGCKTALECTQYCKKHQKECKQSAKQGGNVVGASVKLTASALRRKAAIAGLKTVNAAATTDSTSDPFDNMINTGSETNEKGVSNLSVLSGHKYTVNAGVQSESGFMPPREVEVDLTNAKNATVTLTLRESDGKMTGFVTYNKVAVKNGWVGCWAEDGSNTGSQIVNGTYSLNYTFDTLFHCNANAFDGQKFLNSEETVISVSKEKKKRLDFSLGAASFQVPPNVSESFDATQPHVMTLTDGTTLNIPANAIASSGTVTVNANPTINIQSQKSAQPVWYGYQFEANDSDGKAIVTFNDNITMCFKYTDERLAEIGIDESSLLSNYWDAASGTWKSPPNTTQDKENNTICVSAKHFTAYAVVTSSGMGRGQQLTAVKASKKNGITKVTIGTGKSKKTVTPFPAYKGDVNVVTFRAGKKAGQVIIATQGGDDQSATILKVYSIKGKLTQKITPWGASYRKGASLSTGDLTGDTISDLVAAPIVGGQAHITDFVKRKDFKVTAPSTGRVVAQALNLLGKGVDQLALSVGSRLETWKYVKNKFSKFSFDSRRIRVSGTSIERVRLQPTIASVAPQTMKVKKKGVTSFTISGANLGKGSRVLLGGTLPAVKIVANGESSLTVTVDASKLKKNKKYSVTVINPDGEQTQYQSITAK